MTPQVVIGGIVGAAAATIGLWILTTYRIRGSLEHLPRAVCLACGANRGLGGWLAWMRRPPGSSCWRCSFDERLIQRGWIVGSAIYVLVGWFVVEPDQGRLRWFVAALLLLWFLVVELRIQATFVPDAYVAILFGLALALEESPVRAGNALLGALIAVIVSAVFILITHWIFRSMALEARPMGKPDLYLAAVAGSLVGADAIVPAMVIAVILTIVIGVVGPVVRRSLRRRIVPFGPCLLAGALIALLL